jgi:hypothetical protein
MSDSTPRRWLVITTVEKQDENGEPIPIGAAVNVIMWDGVSDWTPPEGTRVEPA